MVPTVYAQVDWSPAEIRRLNDAPALVMRAPTTTSLERGQLEFSATDMDALTRTLQLTRVGASARLPTTLHKDLLCLFTPHGLCLLHRNRVWYATFWNELRGEDRNGSFDAASLPLVIIGGYPILHSDILETVRDAAKRKLAGMAAMTVLDHRPRETSSINFRFLASDGQVLVAPRSSTTVVPDLNVLIDMKQALTRRKEPKDFTAIRGTVSWLRCVDFRPGFAITEASMNPKRGSENARDVKAAVNAWFDTDPRSSSWPELRVRYENEQNRLSYEQTPDTWIVTILIDSNYLALLKLLELWKPLEGRRRDWTQRMSAARSWFEYRDHVDAVISGYMSFVVMGLLLGNKHAHKNARRLIQNGRQRTPQATLRAAAWDLLYPTLLDMANSGLFPDTQGGNVTFMTRDVALSAYRELTQQHSLLNTKYGPLSAVGAEILSEDLTSRQRVEVAAIMEQSMSLSAERILIPPTRCGLLLMHNKLQAEIEVLERSIYGLL